MIPIKEIQAMIKLIPNGIAFDLEDLMEIYSQNGRTDKTDKG